MREKDLWRIDKNVQTAKSQDETTIFAIGIYDEKLCEILGVSTPLKSTEDRVKIMEAIKGVDFAFSIPSTDKKIVESRLKEAYDQYLQQKTKVGESKKEYKIGYAPGTYDLFHLGHLENIIEASNKCEFLVVGVKDDDLVREHKNKEPVISAEERMEILRHLKMVDDVYRYYVRDLHGANEWIKEKYGEEIGAVFLGSDLKNDFNDVTDLNIIFTERPPELMKVRSSTALRSVYLGRKSNSNKRYSKGTTERRNKNLDGEIGIGE